MHLWRISRARFSDSVFTGEGARLFGGRWNRIGVSVVYTATSVALAALETYVNSDPSDFPDDLIVSQAVLPDSLVIETVELGRGAPETSALDLSKTREIGADWIRSGRAVALKVPSFAVEEDWNVLLNPKHPDFHLIERLPSRP